MNQTLMTYLVKTLLGVIVYGDVQELLPRDAPKPLGKPVTTITFKGENLYHDMRLLDGL
jgi:hypothetical protein